jgi:hypothetical protein
VAHHDVRAPGARSRPRVPRARLAALIVVALAFLATVGVAAGEIIGTKNAGHLTAVGPISETDGFPVWYKGDAGKKLQFCLDPNEPLCGFLPGDVPDDTKPISFPDNWPGEIFYFLAGSDVTPPGGGSIDATLGLEATFANEEPIDGDQMVFGRIRFVGKGLQAGASYTITHPYGVDKFTAAADGSFKFVEDIGISPGQFGGALNSRIGPFLRWDPAVAPAAPAGYVGDPNVEHAITGSPYNTNLLKACVTPAAGGAETCAQNTQFTVQGKYATNGGVEPARATYSRTTTTGGTLDVFAAADLGAQSIEVSGTGVDPTRLTGEQGHYVGHVEFTGAPPATVKLTNVSDSPVSTKSIAVTDGVSGIAVYDADKDTLTVDATSTDTATSPALTATGFGALTAGHLVAENVSGPPPAVTVKSAAGGSADLPVAITGKGYPAIPVQAFAGADQQALSGTDVKLDGSGSTGPVKSYAWKQTGGDPTVSLTGADTATPTFRAPTVAADQQATLTFELSVSGSGGPSTSTVKVLVRGSAPVAVAKAGPDQTVDQNAVVTLDGSASTEATKYQWKQTGGPAVTLTGDTTARPTFRAPKTATTFTFALTATGPGGSSTDAVQITTRPDVLPQPTVEYRTSKREWRINGTSSVVGPGVTITIYLGPTASGTVLASPQVDTLGAWQFRNTGPAPSTTNPRISLKSSSGGQLLNVPVSVRN